MPVKGVLIIPDRRDERDDEPPRTAYFDLAGSPVGVLPQQAVIFFMQADGVGQGFAVRPPR